MPVRLKATVRAVAVATERVTVTTIASPPFSVTWMGDRLRVSSGRSLFTIVATTALPLAMA